VASALYGEPWAIHPDKLRALVDALERRRAGVAATSEDLERLRVANEERLKAATPGATVRDVRGMSVRQFGTVAVLPLYGTVTQRPGMFTRYSGGTSAEQFAAAHEELVNDSAVSAIVWDVDSPGGSVAGVPEAADKLHALKGQKRTVASSNALMASAAYWLAASADEIVATPSSLTGSIGVYTAHEDHSRANAVAGVSVTYVYAGKKKVDGNPDAPLAEPARQAMQQMVDDYYGQFVAAVARGRKASLTAVRNGFGEGDVLTASRALTANLVDRVETLPATLARLGAKGGRKGHELSLAEAIQRTAAARQ
jgi:signal peptide peptidase SppA